MSGAPEITTKERTARGCVYKAPPGLGVAGRSARGTGPGGGETQDISTLGVASTDACNARAAPRI